MELYCSSRSRLEGNEVLFKEVKEVNKAIFESEEEMVEFCVDSNLKINKN